ncbi:hypothetical protein OS493_019306 [Desmophyllum pertusum]|uniref:Uncharacterized protein n=1 Tax=Desmophyllum pertusum TaxID=174260 RepID=A0A9X0A150_9CNID|nr:hypothetical protein OS493_019306 [Desmophyllum pertusum]
MGIMRDAHLAVQEKSKSVHGIKGPSWFAALQHHDIILGTAVDYMHCALEGIMKLLLELWFTSKESQEPFNISKRVEEEPYLRQQPVDFSFVLKLVMECITL